MGHFDSKRTRDYVIDWEKVRTYVVPKDLNEFKVGPIRLAKQWCNLMLTRLQMQLTPFVTKRAETRPSKYTKQIEQNGKTYTVNDRLRGKHFLRLWADRNDEEVFQHAREEVEEEGVRDDHAQKIQGEAKKQ